MTGWPGMVKRPGGIYVNAKGVTKRIVASFGVLPGASTPGWHGWN